MNRLLPPDASMEQDKQDDEDQKRDDAGDEEDVSMIGRLQKNQHGGNTRREDEA